MLLYDWNKIFDVTKGNPSAIYLIIKLLVNKEIPRNNYDKIFKYANLDFSGDCFLVHPDILLYHSYKHSFRDIAQYIALASLRPLADYLATGDKTLDLLTCEVDRELFNDNSLLHIKKNRVYFKYEEVNKKDIH
jgi:hypothetical protein